MTPGSTQYLTGWVHDVWKNRFLFWAVMAGFITIFPILYIPGLNDTVVGHKGISWEWGVVFIEATLFFSGVEMWKFCKRVYIRHVVKDDFASGPEDDPEMGAFSRYTLAFGTTNGLETKRLPMQETKESVVGVDLGKSK